MICDSMKAIPPLVLQNIKLNHSKKHVSNAYVPTRAGFHFDFSNHFLHLIYSFLLITVKSPLETEKHSLNFSCVADVVKLFGRNFVLALVPAQKTFDIFDSF